MQGNLHVPFLGGWAGAIPPGYPAREETCRKVTRLAPTQRECGIFAPPLPPPASTGGRGVRAALAAPPARDGSTPQQRTARRGAAERRLDMRLKMG
jgi:hypothetical protein